MFVSACPRVPRYITTEGASLGDTFDARTDLRVSGGEQMRVACVWHRNVCLVLSLVPGQEGFVLQACDVCVDSFFFVVQWE